MDNMNRTAEDARKRLFPAQIGCMVTPHGGKLDVAHLPYVTEMCDEIYAWYVAMKQLQTTLLIKQAHDESLDDGVEEDVTMTEQSRS